MQDQPSAVAILDLAITHLRDNVLPSLDKRAQFELRVTLSALQLVRRTLALTPESDAAELARLTALLGESGDLEALNRVLAERIRSGALTQDSAGLLEHLRRSTMEKLAVDQPNYAAYQRALEE